MSMIVRLAALYLLLKLRRRRTQRRRRKWVHRQHRQLGEYHRLFDELRLDESRFQRYTRLTVAQYDDLLSRVAHHISRQDTNYRLAISAGERLAIFLRYMATGDSYRSIANSFRVGVSTVSNIVPQVAAAIWECLAGEFMAVPNTEGWRSNAVDFEQWRIFRRTMEMRPEIVELCVKASRVLDNYIRKSTPETAEIPNATANVA
ncbi:uncharacterized protein LOC130908829 [Corythoichthys intestinalis]|uniref:uncharacterized protein LOC130908829 n=1 Tax=Corythoichthys intestinalis TaxID=161448 RepID=UPI0025A52AD2|nr:uncharacterized protein LOC130908829 [Corythoichthys intestinalis]